MRIAVAVRLDAALRGLRWLGHALAESVERRTLSRRLRDRPGGRPPASKSEARR